MASGFFSHTAPEPPPEPDEHQQWRPPPWMQAPDDELPAVLPMPRVLARTERVVLYLSVVEVFSVGVRIPVEAVARRRGESPYDWESVLHRHHSPHRLEPDTLRLGLELSDGVRLGTELEVNHRLHDQQPAGPTLNNNGGGGGGGPDRWQVTSNLWLWPLPPPGSLDVVAEWIALGVPESRVTLDSTAMLSAVGDVEPLWAD